MRITVTLLFAVLLVLGVWTWFDYPSFLLGPSPADYTWWWPQEISTYGQKIDFLFYLISAMIVFFYVLTMGLLVYFVFKYSAKRPAEDQAIFSHGNHKLEMLWTAIPAGLLLVIAFSQMSTWAEIKFAGATEGQAIDCEVFASQFDWRFRYPGEDGRFGTPDDIENPFELVVPVGNPDDPDDKFVMNLRSRDVLHSFFVPKLRIKQDAVPGMTIPIWFKIEADDLPEDFDGDTGLSFDLICAELCGWGHYKMAGRVRVLSNEKFAEWMEEKTKEKFSNGTEDDE